MKTILVILSMSILCGCCSCKNSCETKNVNIYFRNEPQYEYYYDWSTDDFWNHGSDTERIFAVWYEYTCGGDTVGIHSLCGKMTKSESRKFVKMSVENISRKINNSQRISKIYITNTENLSTLRVK